MFYLCSIGSNLDPAQHVSQAVEELLARWTDNYVMHSQRVAHVLGTGQPGSGVVACSFSSVPGAFDGARVARSGSVQCRCPDHRCRRIDQLDHQLQAPIAGARGISQSDRQSALRGCLQGDSWRVCSDRSKAYTSERNARGNSATAIQERHCRPP